MQAYITHIHLHISLIRQVLLNSLPITNHCSTIVTMLYRSYNNYYIILFYIETYHMGINLPLLGLQLLPTYLTVLAESSEQDNMFNVCAFQVLPFLMKWYTVTFLFV